MAQFASTAEAWAQLAKNPEDRTALIKGLCEKLGGRFERLFYCFGKATKITTLTRPATLVEAMKKTGAAAYRGPKK